MMVVVGLAAAIPSYAQADPSSGADLSDLFEQGQRAIIENRYADASRALEHAVELAPEIPELLASLGFSYFQQARFAEAVPILRRALGIKPGLPNVDLLLAASLNETGRYADALPELESAFSAVADPALRRMAGLQLQRCYSGLGRDREAVQTALRLIEVYPEDPEVLYHAGRVLGHLAYMVINTLSRTSPGSVWTSQALGEAFESSGKVEPAIAEYRRALRINPAQRGIHYRMGRVLLQESHDPEQLAQAIREFELELRADPSNANAAYELGEIYRKRGELEKARRLFAQAIEFYPRFEQAQIALGSVLTSLRRPEEALYQLEAAIAINDRNEVSHYRLAQALRMIGRLQESREALERFVQLRKSQERQVSVGVSNDPVTPQEAEPEDDQ